MTARNGTSILQRIPGIEPEALDRDLLTELLTVYSELDKMRTAMEMVLGLPYEPAQTIARKALARR